MGHLNIVLLLLQNGASPDVTNIVSMAFTRTVCSGPTQSLWSTMWLNPRSHFNDTLLHFRINYCSMSSEEGEVMAVCVIISHLWFHVFYNNA